MLHRVYQLISATNYVGDWILMKYFVTTCSCDTKSASNLEPKNVIDWSVVAIYDRTLKVPANNAHFSRMPTNIFYIFSLPEPKAHVSFSDQICLLSCCRCRRHRRIFISHFHIWIFFSKTTCTWPISTKLGRTHNWVEGI